MTPDELAELTRRYLELAARRDEAELELTTIKAKIRDAHPTGTNLTTTDGVHVAVTANRRFDPTLAADVIPADLLTLCQVVKVDPATARKTLPPALYDACMVDVGEPVVRIT